MRPLARFLSAGGRSVTSVALPVGLTTQAGTHTDASLAAARRPADLVGVHAYVERTVSITERYALPGGLCTAMSAP